MTSQLKLRRSQEALQDLCNKGDIRGFFGLARAGRRKKNKKRITIAVDTNLEAQL